MSPSFIDKLWNASPASLMRAGRRRLRRKETLRWFTVQDGVLKGIQLLLPGTEGAWAEMIAGTFDDFIYKEIGLRGGLTDKVIWDIGAHFGFHSLGFAKLGAAEVVAFEPNSANAAMLTANLQRNEDVTSRIKTLPLALSDVDGQSSFMQTADVATGSSGSYLAQAQVPLGPESYAHFHQVTVKTSRIDTLLSEPANLKTPQVLKIDVEGAEALVLKGATKLLQRFHPWLFIEVHHICAMCELRGLLDQFGYSVKILDPAHSSPSRCFLAAA
jgi:FkbM family methyltransferase